MTDTFTFERRVAFADTDAMRVTHHANYLRYCEETRVAWMRARNLTRTHFPHAERVLAVLSYRVRHLAPSTFDDSLEIDLQARREGARVRFHYRVRRGPDLVAEAETVHIVVDRDLRATKPDPALLRVLEREPWREDFIAAGV